jgi:hypothetical protein
MMGHTPHQFLLTLQYLEEQCLFPSLLHFLSLFLPQQFQPWLFELLLQHQPVRL